MRGVAAFAMLALTPVLLTGCTAGDPRSAAVPRAAASASAGAAGIATAEQQAPTDPQDQRACRAARQAISDSTAQMTEQVNKAVAAADRGDDAAQTAAISAIRSTFTGWSAMLRTQAGKAADPHLRSVLTQYAGAVDATIAGVRGPDDLDKLSSFDDQELDQVANGLQNVCGG